EWLSAQAPNWLSGRVAFGVSMLKTAMQSPATRVIMQLHDRHEWQLTVANLYIANARYFGGGMKIAPEAKLTDGRFDVVSIGDLGSLKIIASAPRIYLGSHLSMPEVTHALAKKVMVRAADSTTKVNLQIDGELP